MKQDNKQSIYETNTKNKQQSAYSIIAHYNDQPMIISNLNVPIFLLKISQWLQTDKQTSGLNQNSG